jgi:hypothetical protein
VIAPSALNDRGASTPSGHLDQFNSLFSVKKNMGFAYLGGMLTFALSPVHLGKL